MERNDRCSVIHSALVTLAQRGKRRPKQTLQRIVLPPLQPQLQVVSEVFADNISSMHTTQPQLQRVSQVKLVICVQRCGPSGMFLLSACFGMFDFGMFKYFLLSACCIPHTHIHIHLRPGAGLARGREAGLNCVSATLCSADMTDSVSCMQTFIVSFLSFCFGRFGPTRSC